MNRQRIGTDTLGAVLQRYHAQNRTIRISGTSIRLENYAVIVNDLHAEAMLVELYDAELGLQLFDPDRKTPIGRIQPNPYRDGTEAP